MRHLKLPILLAVVAAPVTAQFTLVAPPICATTEGSANNVFPWGRTTDQRYQQIFDSSTFSSQTVTYPILINNLRFRANATTASWPGGQWPGPIDIKLSTSPVDYLAYSTTFASNQGGDLTTVYSGAVTKLPGTGNGTSTPAPWFIDIALTTPFLYDPNLGDLTMDVFMNAAGFTGTVTTAADAHSNATNALCSRLWADGTGTLVAAGSAANYGVVTEFGYVPANGLFASFSATPSSGPVGMTANFTDASYSSDPGGVLTWAWDLDGDSNIDSNLQNPSFTYTTCGAYNVTLTVTDATNPASTLTRTGYIQVGITPITPNFTQVQTGPATWQFTDTSSPTPSTWAWDFDGDNIVDSNQQNPTWVYPACAASANVTLTVTNSCNAPYAVTRSVTLLPPMVASFTYAPIAAGVYQFTDTSAPAPTSWAWDLDGDSLVDSTVQNPVWAYTSPCLSVPVTLTAADACNNSGTTTRPVVASPTSFTTTLAPNNGLSGAGAGNLFSIDVTNPNGVAICALTLTPYTTAIGNPITCDVYVTDGGHTANHSNAAAWRHVASGVGTDTGVTGAPTDFALNDTIYLPMGTYGMGISTSQGLRYRTEPANPTVYAGPDFTITTGYGKSPLFATGFNSPRGICATFHYSIAGNGNAAGYGWFGPGCAGTMGISSLTANAPPTLGSTMNVTVNNLPANVAIMMTGFSKTNWVLGSLPASLAAYGAPGCNLRVSPDANLLLLGAGNSAVWPFTIPSAAGLIGLNLYNQAVVLDPGFNAAGAVGSDAAGMMIGL